MGKRYLVDSNAIIDFCNGKLPANGKNFLSGVEPEISIVTNIELFGTRNIDPKERQLLEDFVFIATVHPVDLSLVETTISIRQNYNIKLPDAIIAATALTLNITLVSRNRSDFGKIAGLNLIDPYTI